MSTVVYVSNADSGDISLLSMAADGTLSPLSTVGLARTLRSSSALSPPAKPPEPVQAMTQTCSPMPVPSVSAISPTLDSPQPIAWITRRFVRCWLR